jgi:hypothetical protein
MKFCFSPCFKIINWRKQINFSLIHYTLNWNTWGSVSSSILQNISGDIVITKSFFFNVFGWQIDSSAERLSSKREALSSNPNILKRKNCIMGLVVYISGRLSTWGWYLAMKMRKYHDKKWPKKYRRGWGSQCLTPVVLATLEAEMGKITGQKHLDKKVASSREKARPGVSHRSWQP